MSVYEKAHNEYVGKVGPGHAPITNYSLGELHDILLSWNMGHELEAFEVWEESKIPLEVLKKYLSANMSPKGLEEIMHVFELLEISK